MFYLTLTIIVVGPIITILNTKLPIYSIVNQITLAGEHTEWRIIAILLAQLFKSGGIFFNIGAPSCSHQMAFLNSSPSSRHRARRLCLLSTCTYRVGLPHTLITIPTSIYFAVALPDVGVQWQHFLISFIVLIEHSNIRFGWPISYVFITPWMFNSSFNAATSLNKTSPNISHFGFVFARCTYQKDEYSHTGAVISFDTMFTNYFPPFQKHHC